MKTFVAGEKTLIKSMMEPHQQSKVVNIKKHPRGRTARHRKTA